MRGLPGQKLDAFSCSEWIRISRSWKFIQWCDDSTIYYMYLHLGIDHGTMDGVEVVPLGCWNWQLAVRDPSQFLATILSIPFFDETMESSSGQPRTTLFQSWFVFTASSAHAHANLAFWLTIYSHTRYPTNFCSFAKSRLTRLTNPHAWPYPERARHSCQASRLLSSSNALLAWEACAVLWE